MKREVYDNFFNKSILPAIAKGVKTLSKKELSFVCWYMEKYRPINIMEFGVYYGCSTSAFIEIAKWLNYNIKLDSWDIIDVVKFPDRKKFTLHLENITGREKDVFDKYKPDLVFLDAHPYQLTKNVMQICLDRKIDFMAHDVSIPCLNRARNESNNFTNFGVYTTWESYLIGELISKDLWKKDQFENDKLRALCIRDAFGLLIVEHKR